VKQNVSASLMIFLNGNYQNGREETLLP